MTASPLTIRAKVLDTSVYPTDNRRRRWLVRLRVEDVLEGELPEDQREISMLVHSPSRDFHASEPVGETFRIRFEEPLSEEPYAGPAQITPG